MKYCSLCNNPYDDSVKNCSLSHCVSCGSTRIWSEDTKIINPIGISVIFVFFVLIFTSIFYEMKTVNYMFIGIMSGLLGVTMSDSFKRKKSHLCLNCFAKGFTPLTSVTLSQEPRKIQESETFKQIEPEKIKNLFSIQASSENKMKIETIILIIGLAITIVGMIFSSVIQKWVEKSLG